nr:DEAD/DEAH box helicase [Nanchangia anserum]
MRGVGGIDERLVDTRVLPRRDAVYGEWPGWVPAGLRAALSEDGRARLWSHQVEAAQALYEGRHTVVATGTGSGKSLAVWLAYLARAGEAAAGPRSLAERAPTACYLAPTKALARDQMRHVTDLATRAGLGLRVAAADGDTEREAKDFARTRADVVVTNPDFVHHVLLPQTARWTHLLRGLRVIVVDEMHCYRGISGAHVALVLRRLLRQARRLGASPAVALLSATCAHPGEAAARFLGVDPTEIATVSEDGSGSGEHRFVLWRPRVVSESAEDGAVLYDDDAANSAEWVALMSPATGVPGGGIQRRSVTSEGGELTGELVGMGVRLLAFTRSRQGAESLADIARDHLARRYPDAIDTVAAYRGGYLPEERRGLEADVRSGRLRALATTSALELGIDVAGLDATISCGWPGTSASFRQQSGRAGRAGRDGLSVLIASDNPLDAYLCDHPDQVFAPVEASVFDPHNPHVLAPHLCCAAAESPLTEDDLTLFGLSDNGFVRMLAERGLLVRRRSGWYWDISAHERPWDLVDIRGGGHEIQIARADDGTIIGSIDAAAADSQAHLGAIYVHQGRVFRVRERDEDVVVVEPAPPKLRTRVTEHTRVRILGVESTVAGTDAAVTWHVGDVEVERQVSDYDLLRLPGLQFIRNVPLDLPARRFPTRAVWWTLDPELVDALMLGPDLLPGALHAAEHASIGLLPLLATCDRWDLGGLSIAEHPQTGLPTVFVYDGAAGGAGFADYGFAHRDAWMGATRGRVSACECHDGCPRCIQSPKCGTNNDPLYKVGAIDLLARLAPGDVSAGLR